MLSTADVYDDNPDVEVLALPWSSYGARASFSGPAQTVRTHNDNTRVRATLEEPGDGRVLVVDGWESTTHALLGDRLAAMAAANGWAGVVLAGAVRDTARLSDIDLGIVALGSVPRRSRKEGIGVVGEAVSIGGGTVRPGDTVIVDTDGVVVLRAGSKLTR